MTPNAPNPQRPLQGCEPPARGLFIDRWGTLLACAEEPSKLDAAALEFAAGGIDALFRAHHAGWRLYSIGNEDRVALGRTSDAAWADFERALLERLRSLGVRLTRLYACLDHPSGKGAHKKPSVFRLPDTGVMYHALQADGISLQQSWVIGDSTIELAAGARAGCKTIALACGLGLADRVLDVDPDLRCEHLAHAVDLLLRSPSFARAR